MESNSFSMPFLPDTELSVAGDALEGLHRRDPVFLSTSTSLVPSAITETEGIENIL